MSYYRTLGYGLIVQLRRKHTKYDTFVKLQMFHNFVPLPCVYMENLSKIYLNLNMFHSFVPLSCVYMEKIIKAWASVVLTLLVFFASPTCS